MRITVRINRLLLLRRVPFRWQTLFLAAWEQLLRLVIILGFNARIIHLLLFAVDNEITVL